jgi:hypothetical protein
MSTRNHDRGPNGAAISLSTTKELNDAIKKEALRQGRTISNYIANTIALSLGLPPEAVIAPNKRSPRKIISVRIPDANSTIRVPDSEARALAAEAKLAQLSALLGGSAALRELPKTAETPPTRLKGGSPNIRNPRKNDSGQASA